MKSDIKGLAGNLKWLVIAVGIISIGLVTLGVTKRQQEFDEKDAKIQELTAKVEPMKLDTTKNTVSAPATVIAVDGWIYCWSLNVDPPSPTQLGLANSGKILAVQDRTGVRLWTAVRVKAREIQLYYWEWERLYIRPPETELEEK